MKRVFLYVRVSTEEQAIHGLSIGAQTAALETWAAANGHKVAGIYTDAGISARKPASKRPELLRLLEDVKSGKGDLIVFTKLDRWFRNIAEYYKVQEVLETHRVDWKTIQEDYDTSSASGRLKINIMLSVAQDEADRTSERIKAVMEIKRQKREPLTGDCPTGYQLEGKALIKAPEKEAAVSAFFRTYLESGSTSEAIQCARRHGLRISCQLAHKMLSHPCYYGHYYGVDGMTPPYITKEEFDKIQAMRKHIVRKTSKNRVYIFSGLVFCGECGGRMGGRVNTNQASFFYNCTAHYMKTKDCDNNRNPGEKKIEACLLRDLDSAMRLMKLEASGLHEKEKPRDFTAEIQSLRRKCRRVKDLYVDLMISREECRRRIDEYEKAIRDLENLAAAPRKMDASALEAALQEEWTQMYFDLKPEEKRGFWRILLKEIRIHQDRRIEYQWNLSGLS